MTDIVERLRYGTQQRNHGSLIELCAEAADEIERLDELLWQEAGNRVEIERLQKIEPQFLALKEERIRWFADNEWLTTDNDRLRAELRKTAKEWDQI